MPQILAGHDEQLDLRGVPYPPYVVSPAERDRWDDCIAAASTVAAQFRAGSAGRRRVRRDVDQAAVPRRRARAATGDGSPLVALAPPACPRNLLLPSGLFGAAGRSEGAREAGVVRPPGPRSYAVMRLATSYLVTDVRRPGVSPAGIAFSAASPRL